MLGCCGLWANEALDKAISCNKWPVRFEGPDGVEVDLVPEFIILMWLGYCAKMRGHPAPSAKSSQMVLKYLLVNDALVVKAWRNRVYRYSSGTLFADSTHELQEYLNDLNDPSALRRMKDEGRLYELVGEAMFDFMKVRTPTFPNVTLSKYDFWACHAWKRCLLFVFLTRFLYNMDGQVGYYLFMLVCMYYIQVCKLT